MQHRASVDFAHSRHALFRPRRAVTLNRMSRGIFDLHQSNVLFVFLRLLTYQIFGIPSDEGTLRRKRSSGCDRLLAKARSCRGIRKTGK